MREQQRPTTSRIFEVQLWKQQLESETRNATVSQDGKLKVEVKASTVVSRLAMGMGKVVYCNSTDHDRAYYTSAYHLVMTEDVELLQWLEGMEASSSRATLVGIDGVKIPVDAAKVEIILLEWDAYADDDPLSCGLFQNQEEVSAAYYEFCRARYELQEAETDEQLE